MRLHPLVLAAVLAGAALAAAPASALESLDEARCVCADSSVNQGDYVSCLSKFSRRLVLLGVIDKVERSNAIADASSADLDELREGCEDDDGNSLSVDGWGVGLQVGSAFYPAPAPSGVASAAEVKLFLWNFSPQDVLQTTPVSPAGDCGFVVRIYNQTGGLVRDDDSVCLPTTGVLDLPIGSVEERAFVLPLTGFNSTTGLANGERLPTGGYRVEVTWAAFGPNQDDMPSTAGSRPSASISIRVGS